MEPFRSIDLLKRAWAGKVGPGRGRRGGGVCGGGVWEGLVRG